ncbi:MBL fold metallo-hydrolase [Virgibacillus sediminis]|uniref:beta-lactamase n=1 Tax=Virgibacillus sediminis TaxID=202260 RepID=A0ABV7A3L7_9BACI
MAEGLRVIPIGCEFGRTIAYTYYIDAPEPVLIDTGIASSPSEKIVPELAKYGIDIADIRWILLTHGHADHIGGVKEIWERTGKKANIVIPKKEAELIHNRQAHLEAHDQLQGKYLDEQTREEHKKILMHVIGEEIKPTHEVEPGDQLSFGGNVKMSVLSTPGHSLGSVTFLLEETKWAFAADAVQIYGGAAGGFPTIEDATLYRESVKYLLEEVKPNRLYLGHHFLNAHGETVEAQLAGEEVTKALRESLEMDEKLIDIAQRHRIDEKRPGEGEGLYAPFESVADELGYKGDPRGLPSAFFVTLNGYLGSLTKGGK